MTDERKAEERAIIAKIKHQTVQGMVLANRDAIFLLCLVDRLTAELAAMTRERDAAVNDLTQHYNNCKYGEGCKKKCGSLFTPDCRGCKEWEWRGPVAAEGEAHD